MKLDFLASEVEEFQRTALWDAIKEDIGGQVTASIKVLAVSPALRGTPYEDEWLRGRIAGLEYLLARLPFVVQQAVERNKDKQVQEEPEGLGSVYAIPPEND